MITCSNCSFDNPADAKFCQNCGHALELICANCQTPNTATANFCKNCGHALAQRPPTPPENEPNKEKPSGAREAERRVVTLLFCDVAGSTAIGERLDPEAWSEIMNGMFERMLPSITRYGGTVTRLMGDAVLAMFGAPVAHEDDPFRAVVAALEMIENLKPYQEQIRENLQASGVSMQPSDLEVRIGINTGLAVVGEAGSGERREYTAMGDSVNLAARMEQTAEPGTIQIALDTFLAVEPLIEVETLEPLQVKGKREAVRAYRVRGLKTARERRGLNNMESPLVGRNQELNQLEGALSRLQSGHGQIICLIGDGGFGKSRLVEELYKRSVELRPEVNWYMAESLSFESGQPYGLIQRLLRRVGGIARDDPQEVVGRKITALSANLAPAQQPQVENVLRTLFGLQSGSELSQPQGEKFKKVLFESMVTLVQSWSADKPTVLVMEDLHWTDSASVELISHLAALVDTFPLLMVNVFRPYAQSPAWTMKQHAHNARAEHYQEIELKPLTTDASNTLVSGLLNTSALPEKVGALIADKTAGVPYFIEEVVRELVERGALIRSEDGGGWQVSGDIDSIEVPDNLEAVLVSRMDRLDKETRRTLQLAAVIGRSFYFRVLNMIADNNLLDHHMGQLQQAGMILEFARVPELQYIFRHVLAQEAAYNTILFRQRRLYHRQVAEAMEDIFRDNLKEQAPLLAYHFYQAGDEGRAHPYYVIAAESAARLYANEEAVEHYSRAIDSAGKLSADDVSLARLYHGRGQIYEVIGDFEGARLDYENGMQIAGAAGDASVEWELLLDLGKLWASRDYRQAGDYFEKALHLARQIEDPAILARSLNRMGNWYVNAERPQEAVEYHREALQILQELEDRSGLANTLDLLGMANLLAGDNNEAHRYFDRAVALFRELDDRFRLAGSLATQRAGITYHELSVVQPLAVSETAERSTQEALQISREIGWLAGESFALWVLALLSSAYGRYETAFEMVENGLRIATEIDHRQWMAGHEFILGILYCDLLASDKARHHSERALELAGETGSQYWTNQAAATLTKAHLLQGDLSRCEATLSMVLTPSTPMDSFAKRYCWERRAELALAEGEPGTALDIIDRLLASFPGLNDGVIPSLWQLHARALADLGRPDEAESLLQAAIEAVLNGFGQRSHLWNLYATLGNLYWETGRQAQAEEAFSAGRTVVEALAASILDQPLGDNFRQRALDLLEPPTE